MLKFKGYCVEHKIKQQEIADVLGQSIQLVNRKLNGKAPFTLPDVRTLCSYYKISADIYFLSECFDKETE